MRNEGSNPASQTVEMIMNHDHRSYIMGNAILLTNNCSLFNTRRPVCFTVIFVCYFNPLSLSLVMDVGDVCVCVCR